MPMRLRNAIRARPCVGSGWPSMTMRAPSIGTRPLTHLISVLLPEPDGPHTTTISPLATEAEQSLSTRRLPYHLLMQSISIISAVRFAQRVEMRAALLVRGIDNII